MQFNTWITEADVKIIKEASEQFEKAKQAVHESEYREAIKKAYEILTPFIDSLSNEITRREKQSNRKKISISPL